MSKTKYYILGGIFFCLAVGITIASIKPARAETTSTTFPVDEAGIAAYVKLDYIDITDLTEALNYFYSREKQETTYVIGTMKIGTLAPYGTDIAVNYPHLYIGLDGWIVAYFLRTEEASKIMQWKGYEKGSINTTTLKDAIDYISQKIGVSYSMPIKYYDFEFPEANKLTLIAETTDYSSSNSFSVTIPGTLYEASYSVYSTGEYWQGRWYYCNEPINLSVDGISVFFQSSPSCWTSYYGYYDVSNRLTANEPHYISFTRAYGGGAATVLIYKAP